MNCILLNYSLLLFAGKDDITCDDPVALEEINKYTANLKTIIPPSFHIDSSDGCAGISITSNNKYYFLKGKHKIKETIDLFIRFDHKKSADSINNKIHFYDSTCNRMKEIYFIAFPTAKLPNSPFTHLAADSSNNNFKLIKEYNKLAADLWLNENDFPKYHTDNFDIVFFTQPDLTFINDTSFSELKNILKSSQRFFKKYKLLCEWPD